MKKNTKIVLGIVAIGGVAFAVWKLSKVNAKKTFSTSDQTADVYVGDIEFR